MSIDYIEEKENKINDSLKLCRKYRSCICVISHSGVKKMTLSHHIYLSCKGRSEITSAQKGPI